MALLDTFRGILESDEQAEKRINGRLQNLFRGFVERAERLALTAGQAPSKATETDLRKLADDHRATADLIKSALESRKSSAPSSVGAVTASTGVNHWARIVEDLEVFQQGRNQLMELSNDILESYPELTPLFDALAKKTADHIARLRGEIARADPQALN